MRLSLSKSKNATSFYVIKSVYEKGVRSTKIVEKLGTEKELRKKLNGRDPYEWAKAYIDELNRQEKESQRKVIVEFSPTKVIAKDRQASFNGGYLFLQSLYHSLGLHKICAVLQKKYKITFDLNTILASLLYGRILFPGSKLATKELVRNFLEQPRLELQHVYRALEILAKESDFIQAQVYKNSLNACKRNTAVLFYDCTNFFFEIEQAEGLKQYGKGKENRPNPLVEMGLFMDGDGVPLAFCIHPGNTNEQVTLKPLERKILANFKLSQFVVCTDAGLASTANRKFNDIQERAFITTQSIKKLKQFLKEWALDPADWSLNKHKSETSSHDKTKTSYNLTEVIQRFQSDTTSEEEKKTLESMVFYKERWLKEGDLEQRLIVTFSLKYKNYQEIIRSNQIERARKIMEKNPAKLKKCNANDYRRFIQKSFCTPDGELAEKELLSINQDVINEEAQYDGFYAVCTNLEDSISDIVKVNKGRWEIEECFRIIKSEFKARPVYLSRDDRITAHFMTCFLSLILYRMLEKKLGGEFTCKEILTTIRDMNFYKIPGEGVVPTYKRTNITDALHSHFGFRTDYEIVNTKELKRIFNFTKK
ncbi:IS1634 family transposase [Desulfoscipio sp. XC116]|uniref:IS1634 family transposase n=1 Tax=Desulfoscipio sp. XC116 TaxID=3144975 RepID=UPI00325BE598